MFLFCFVFVLFFFSFFFLSFASSKANFSTFCNLIAQFLSQNSVKDLRVTKIVEEIKFEGVCDKLERYKCFHRKSFTKYLRLILVSVSNSALQEKSNLCFSSFLLVLIKLFILAGRLGNRLSFYGVQTLS